MKLRPYQSDAVDCVFAEWGKAQSTLAVLPTGMGKTVLFSAVIDRARKNTLWPGQWMVVVHREELAHQAAEKLEAIGLNVQLEMGKLKAELSVLRRPDVVVASIQTLIRRGLRFKPHEFAGLILDEAHHYVSKSWRGYVEHLKQNPDLKILGVTATPNRADEAALKAVFETVAYHYELRKAIAEGWLVDINVQQVFVEGMDFSGVKSTGGDLNGRQLAEVMSAEKVLHQIANATIRETEGKKTILFAPPGFKTTDGGESFRVSERLCEILNRYRPGSAALVSDKTEPDLRKQTIKSFKEGRIQYFVNVGIATEGFDVPDIDAVVMARPTESTALFTQMIGRGTRPLPGLVDGVPTAEARRAAIAGSAKPHVKVLDFVGVTGKHKLVSVVDILGGDQPEAVQKLAHAKITQSGRAMSVDEAIAEAKQTIAEQKAREAAEAARREAVRLQSLQYKTVQIDPFNVFDLSPVRKDGTTKVQPATEAQRKTLGRMGYPCPPELSKNDASVILGELLARRRQGLCTIKQANMLKKNGIDPKNVTFKDAMWAIDLIMKGQKKKAVEALNDRSWQVPECVA